MKNTRKYLRIHLMLFLFFFPRLMFSQTYEDLHIGSTNEALSMLETTFNMQPNYINYLVSNKFRNTQIQSKLEDCAANYKINLNNLSFEFEQTFYVNLNKNTGKYEGTLKVLFKLDKKTNKWLIEDAECNGLICRNFGFDPLAHEFHFVSFLQSISDNRLYGIAPHGKINSIFLQNNTFDIAKNKCFIVKNAILYDENFEVIDIFYFKYKYYENEEKETVSQKMTGWLIVDANSHSKLYEKSDDLYVNLKLNGKLNFDKDSLTQKSAYYRKTNFKVLNSNKRVEVLYDNSELK